MSKSIVIFSDGTGNSAIKGRGTNVFKMFEAVDLNSHRTNAALDPQIAFYDDGVGTESLAIRRLISGATGAGLTANVRQLYREICRVYDPGDRIYLFGFSRGAFTVRTLVGFIDACGMVDRRKLKRDGLNTTRQLRRIVREAYAIYRADGEGTLLGWVRRRPELSKDAFKELYSHEACGGAKKYEVPIKFVGVWDSVDAVGMPFKLSDLWNRLIYRFKFKDTKLSKSVEFACQALAIDEARDAFQPLVWNLEGCDAKRKESVEQVWFAGAHSNVGGGYPKQGMSLVALEWMMSKAAHKDLRFVEGDRRLAHDHASVDDKLYDPRSGLGIFYRWKPRDIVRLCNDNHIDPHVHVSVLERITRGTDDYAPGNVPATARVVITPSGGDDGLALARAAAVQRVLWEVHQGKPEGSLLSDVARYITAGYWSHWLYVTSCVAVLCAVALGQLADGGALGSLMLGFGASLLLSSWADNRMGDRFSEFWHSAQSKFVKALKAARTSQNPDGLSDVLIELAPQPNRPSPSTGERMGVHFESESEAPVGEQGHAGKRFQ